MRELCPELLTTQDAGAIETLGDKLRRVIHDHVQELCLTIRAFLAFFFVLLGVGIMFGHDQLQAVTGAFISALGLTFFWRLGVAILTGN
jgi:putative effector of murein hydrolase LrgA (UPF0299 family)